MHTSDLNFYRPGAASVHLAPGFRPKLPEACAGSVPISGPDPTGENARQCGAPVEGDEYLCVSCRAEVGEA